MKEYIPKPIDVSDVEIPTELEPLREAIAENIHEVWSAGRMKEGWTYGPVRDDKQSEKKRKTDEAEWKEKRKLLKDWPSRAHLDICSIEELAKREKSSKIKLDEKMSKAIPFILKIEEHINQL